MHQNGICSRIQSCIYYLVTDQVPETWVSSFGYAMDKWVKGRRLHKAFLYTLAKILAYLNFFKVERAKVTTKLRKIIKYAEKNVGKQMKKILVLNPFFSLFRVPENLISGIRSITNMYRI